MSWESAGATVFLGLLFLTGWLLGYRKGLKYGRAKINKQCTRCGHVYNADAGDHDCNGPAKQAVQEAINVLAHSLLRGQTSAETAVAIDALIVARLALYDRKEFER